MEELHSKTPEPQEVSFSEAREWLDRKWVTARFREDKVDWEMRARAGFHPVEELRKAKGPTVEVAGPTDEGFFFHDIKEDMAQPHKTDLFKERKVFVSNLFSGRPEFAKDKFSHFTGTADFIADAQKLPAREGRVGVLFCSCIGPIGTTGMEKMRKLGFEKTVSRIELEREAAIKSDIVVEESAHLREEVFQEARRVLRAGGLFIWQGGLPDDLKFALNSGFILLQIERRKTASGTELAPKMIFQKKYKEK